MTVGEVYKELKIIIQNYYCSSLDERELELNVFFDFPLIPGSGTKGYKISSITKKGIIIRNEDIERPKGHP